MERGERAMKKMLVYPFNRDFLPVCACADQLIGYEISALVSPAGFGCGGKIVPCGSKMIAVSERIEEHLAECDVVFLAECWFPVDFDTVLLPELQQAVRLGKQILLTENSYREYERSLSEHGLLEAASLLCIPQWRDCEPIVLPLEVPVVYVVGTMQNTGKFQTAMGIKQMLEARGYKISLVGSRCESTLFRDTPFPAYMTDRYYTEAQRIYSFNRLMKNIELEERPDLILVAVPGAVLPSGHKHIEDFGLTATLVQLAAPPDAVVCCSLCPIGEKSLSYYRVIERDVDRKMGVPITAHFSSPYIIDFLSLESGGKQQFLSVNQEFLTERISQSGKTDLFPVGSPAGLSSASESIIRVLGG